MGLDLSPALIEKVRNVVGVRKGWGDRGRGQKKKHEGNKSHAISTFLHLGESLFQVIYLRKQSACAIITERPALRMKKKLDQALFYSAKLIFTIYRYRVSS